MVSGPARIVEEGALEHINMLAKKYLGEDKYPYLGPGERRVIIEIRPSASTASAQAARATGASGVLGVAQAR